MNTNTTSPTSADQSRTLTVRVGSPTGAFDRVADAFEAIDRDEEPELLYEVTLQREADLQRLLSPKNVGLLRAIAREEPDSIRDLARRVDRDIRQVHDNLTELETYGLVELEDAGRAKRPRVWYDDIEIEVPIAAERSV
jgi:predicted transcriptional regulator